MMSHAIGETRQVTLQPSGRVLAVWPGETLLEAARREGLAVPQACPRGDCQACAALLVEGLVRQAGGERRQGEVLACQAVPLGDCLLHWDEVLVQDGCPEQMLDCQLVSCQPLGGDVYQVILRPLDGRLPRYFAGQYLQLQREDGSYAAFSLASAPGRPELELHILAREGSSRLWPGYLQHQARIRVRLPFGDAHLARLPDGPLILVAAGTGMAQMQGLIEHCRAMHFAYPVHLYWGARQAGDFYRVSHWAAWQHWPGLTLHKVVSEGPGGEGRRGLLHEAICEDFSDFRGLQVYASGSPAMVYATLDALVAAGMDARQMRADVFAYAPRS